MGHQQGEGALPVAPPKVKRVQTSVEGNSSPTGPVSGSQSNSDPDLTTYHGDRSSSRQMEADLQDNQGSIVSSTGSGSKSGSQPGSSTSPDADGSLDTWTSICLRAGVNQATTSSPDGSGRESGSEGGQSFESGTEETNKYVDHQYIPPAPGYWKYMPANV